MSVESAAATRDPGLPTLGPALDCALATAAFQQADGFADARVRVTAARLTRHKMGRRCLIEYDVDAEWADGRRELTTVIGKMRAGHRPGSAARRLQAFWQAGFSASSPDGISVPEPLGEVPGLDLWLQRKVDGVPATSMMATSAGTGLATRLVVAAEKVHAAAVPTRRTHSIGRELEILADVLAKVAAQTGWGHRVTELLRRCAAVGTCVSSSTTGIHRDFYADQVIVDGSRLWLVDFDLYCLGPTGVDLGNFCGHLAEHAVRQPEQAAALAAAERAIAEAVQARQGDQAARDVRAFTLLTLARHVYLCTVIPERVSHADRMLSAALDRLEEGADDAR